MLNLTIDSSCNFGSYTAGSVAALASGNVVLQDVHNQATVEGFAGGGLIGAWSGSGKLTVERCTNSGSIKQQQ